MQADAIKELESSSYYAVVRALYACGRLQNFDSDLLLIDLQGTLCISSQAHLGFLEQVKNDTEAEQLAQYGEEVPTDSPHLGLDAPRSLPQPAPLYIPPSHFETPYSTTHMPLATSKSKKGTVNVSGLKQSSKRSKSGGSTPSTPRSLHAKASIGRSGDKRLAGAAAAAAVAASHHNQLSQAQSDLEHLNVREREIFEALIKMGVTENDSDLNEVHRHLIKWYKLDMRQREIVRELNPT